MFGLAFYLAGCFVVTLVVVGILMMLRPVHLRNDNGTLKAGIPLFLLCVAAPYGRVEYLTGQYGTEMESAIQEAFAGSEIDGELQFYRVVSVSGEHARAIAVGLETEGWGGTDRPVIAINLDKVGGSWEPTSYYTVYSDRLQRDSSTFPPYR